MNGPFNKTVPGLGGGGLGGGLGDLEIFLGRIGRT